jgi:uncharacterized protein (DUF305 family)
MKRQYLTIACGLVVAACSTRPAEVAPAPVAVNAAARSDSIARAQARADSMERPYTKADVQFMQHMISHHAQAIDMSQLAPTHGASESVKILAARIINAQKDEIALMQRWLSDRNQVVPEAKAAPMKMMHGGVEHEMMMPGMLTDEQMKELAQARGQKFDELFLRYMIQHHEGAVGMVSDLLASHGAAQDNSVFRIATDINVDQTTEIARMRRMLAEITLGVKLP